MKRLFLLLAAATALSSASALDLVSPVEGPLQTKKTKSIQWPATRAGEESLTFGYCYDYYTCVGAGAADSYDYAYIAVPEEIAAQWKGATITRVNIGFGRSSVNDIEVIVTKDPKNGTPIYTQNAKMTVSEGWNQVILNTPVVVDGEGFFIGYGVDNPLEDDCPIGVDYTYSENPYGDIVGVIYPEYGLTFENIGTMFGSVCIQIVLEGDGLPQNNASVEEIDLPPFMTTNTPFSAAIYVGNNGVKAISSLEVSAEIGGVKLEGVTCTIPEGSIANADAGEVIINNLYATKEGVNQTVVITIDKVNGVANENTLTNSIQGKLNVSDTGYDRNVLVEEFTGTWCGWCPRGIVGMAYMKENYGDKGFIGVAVHYNDVMQSPTYVLVNNEFSGGSWPSAVADRSIYFNPSSETMEEIFKYLTQYPAYASTDVKAVYSEADNVVNVTSTTEFALDMSAAGYKMAYALVEDNVGPYFQNNSFPSGQGEYLPGWSNAPARVSTIYNEVGREIKDPFGMSFSVPTTIKKGEKYEHSAVLSVPAGVKIWDCHVVAMILDNNTYAVVNSCKGEIANKDAGVEGIADDAEQVYKVYNPQGVKVLETKDKSEVNALAPGIYIVNGKKVLISK